MSDTSQDNYTKTEEQLEKLWSEAIFVFDTNVLLHLHRYSPETSKEFLGILEKLAAQDRLWIPYQVALEYHTHKQLISEEVKGHYERIRNDLDKPNEDIKRTLSKLQERLQVSIHSLQENIDDAISKVQEEIDSLQTTHIEWLNTKEIDGKLIALCRNRVGTAFTFEELSNARDEGADRYIKSIPPGYLDSGKRNTDQYGDFIIWLQIIKFTTENNKPILFITDDQKADWWADVNGMSRPRSELIDEIGEKASQDFHMYVSSSFLEEARERLSIEITDDALEEVETALERNTLDHSPFSLGTSRLGNNRVGLTRENARLSALTNGTGYDSHYRSIREFLDAEIANQRSVQELLEETAGYAINQSFIREFLDAEVASQRSVQELLDEAAGYATNHRSIREFLEAEVAHQRFIREFLDKEVANQRAMQELLEAETAFAVRPIQEMLDATTEFSDDESASSEVIDEDSGQTD